MWTRRSNYSVHRELTYPDALLCIALSPPDWPLADKRLGRLCRGETLASNMAKENMGTMSSTSDTLQELSVMSAYFPPQQTLWNHASRRGASNRADKASVSSCQ